MKKRHTVIFLLLIIIILTGCSTPSSSKHNDQVKLILGAYTTPREAYGEIIPLFQDYWKAQTGQTVIIEESYLGSGAQSRAVIDGFEADIVALSLEADVNRIQEAGLITHDWKAGDHRGIVTTSVVAFAVRPGNPKNIQGWDDLIQPGLEILTPNPSTSGGAMWNILGLYGAALRGKVDGVPGDDAAAAEDLMKAMLKNVTVMDKAARDSILNFEKGIGDVAITYENEVLVGRQSGQVYELVIPTSTILIQNPIAIVDASVEKHGTRAVAEGFLAFLYGDDAQEIFANHGLRVVNSAVADANKAQYPPVPDLFTIDYFGGWDQIMTDIFGPEGVFSQAILEVHRGE